jgi:hypothetical protein
MLNYLIINLVGLLKGTKIIIIIIIIGIVKT